MRPVRLELADFGSFRGPEVIDFDDVDLFVLAGPTGAGKTTIVDAMCFALYGSVPRYEHANLKEPVINRTADQARLRFDFTLGERRFRVGWVVKRGAGGKVATEARLERVLPELDAAGEPRTHTLASGSREVRETAERLLGLTFDEFTKTVVLPQGAFAELLHGGRTERQDLLVRLLDLAIYREIGQAARSRAELARGRAEQLQSRIDELAEATDEAVALAAARVDQLAEIRRQVDDALPHLDELREAFATAKANAVQVAGRAEALAAVRRPAGVDDLAQRIADARAGVEAAVTAEAAATERLAESVEAADELPTLDALQTLRAAATALQGAIERAEGTAQAAEDAGARAATADAARDEARRRRDEAAERRDVVRRHHLAAALAAGLAAGDDCPVCARPLDDAPAHELPADLDEAEAAAAAAEEALQAADREARRAAGEAAAATAEATTATERLADARAALEQAGDRLPTAVVADGTADLEVVAQFEARRRSADETIVSAQAAVQAAADAVRSTRQALGELEDAERRAWSDFDESRDRVAALGAPAADRDDLTGAWDALTAWAQQAAEAARHEAEQAHQEVEQARAAGVEHGRGICRLVADAGVDLPDDAKPESAVAALGGAQQQAASATERLREQVSERTRLAAERATLGTNIEVADALGEVLRKDRFEKWLLNRLSIRLVVGASAVLRELTNGTYSLKLDDAGTFAIVDHANADETRSARTLSGGETFLASLALALALAEHVASINHQGATRLDALFLDEGFGTLDAEALDTVAAAIEDLSRRQDRMVGIITHVRDLADRIPVRYEVTKGPEGSKVRKVVNAVELPAVVA